MTEMGDGKDGVSVFGAQAASKANAISNPKARVFLIF